MVALGASIAVIVEKIALQALGVHGAHACCAVRQYRSNATVPNAGLAATGFSPYKGALAPKGSWQPATSSLKN